MPGKHWWQNNGVLDHLRHGTVLPIRDIGAIMTMSQYSNPEFKLFVDNATPAISKGGTAKVNVSELTTNRFSGIVTYSVTGLTGTGLSASFSNATTTTAGTTVLTLSASGTASSGIKNINLVGASGSITVTVPLSVQVSAN